MSETLTGEHEHEDNSQKGDKGEQGIPGESPGPELYKAVIELSSQVGTLTEQLKQYPSRTEVRKDGRRRMWKALGFGVVLILVANFFTVSMVSYCFLADAGTTHSACNLMPGYHNTVLQGNERLARFNLIITQIEKNRLQIKEIQMRLDKLEKEPK